MTDHLVDANKKEWFLDENIGSLLREAGWHGIYVMPMFKIEMHAHEIMKFARLVAAQEREACAKTCESIASVPSSLWSESGCWAHAAEACVAEIRERS